MEDRGSKGLLQWKVFRWKVNFDRYQNIVLKSRVNVRTLGGSRSQVRNVYLAKRNKLNLSRTKNISYNPRWFSLARNTKESTSLDT